MQTIPGWSSTAEVTSPTAVVAVDGAPLEADVVSVSRELASSLPGSLLGGSGLTAASGTVVWSQPDDATDRSPTPWARRGAIPPPSGSRVVAAMGNEHGTCVLLTGRVDAADGTFADGQVSSDLVDDIDRLNRPITMQPLMNAMPPVTPGAIARYIGMSGIWIADQVLRRCGFNATPAVGVGAVVSVTAMGSMWPEVGEVTTCAAPVGGAFPVFASAPWGLCVQDVDATYTPSTARLLDAPMEILLQWPGAEAGNPNITVTFGTATLRMVLSPTLVALQAPSGTNVVTVARGAASRAIARITPTGSNITAELRTDTGAAATATVAAPAGLLANAMTAVRVLASGTARVGAARVSFPASAFAGLTHTPTAVFTLGGVSMHNIVVQPSIIGRDALTLLKEHAAAVGSAMWLDEVGRLRWVARDAIGTGPVSTLTSEHDLLDASWSDQWRDVYSGVEVTWSDVTVTRASRDSVTLWAGGGSVDSGDVVADVVHPASGEDWIMVDTSITKAGPSSTLSDFNFGLGSFTGAVLSDASGEAWAATTLVDTALRRIDWRSYAITTTVGSVPSGKNAELQGPSEAGTGVWSARFGQELPVLRGRGKFQVVKATTAAVATGPDGAAVYTHDAGWWVQTQAQAQALADWIATTATVRTPYLDDVEVNFDPRRQLGDRVVLEDRHRSGLRVTGLVFGLRHTVSAGNGTSRLSLRVTQVERIAPSLDDYDLVWSGATLDDRDTYWAGKTLDQFDLNPLARS
ncbi:hypothetical protein [Cellulosimicrobium sp. I38E]|uniref:hypothetical protein n=1 Tax=Cellulosimicrobium sp. I38E TaxID=1393139 RepID=UPI0007B2BA6C|nr:hypothetical protein [Cellulosimicrobium sp. I38E]KZM78406.1 hypothetical protein A0J59_13835 [Cellulosimicrobium sp. I38E]